MLKFYFSVTEDEIAHVQLLRPRFSCIWSSWVRLVEVRDVDAKRGFCARAGENRTVPLADSV